MPIYDTPTFFLNNIAKMAKFFGFIVLIVLYNGSFCMGQTTQESETYTGTPLGQIDNDTESGFPPIGEDVLSTSIDKGMMPIYDITKFFLDKVIAVNTLAELNRKASNFYLHISFKLSSPCTRKYPH